MPYQDLRDYLQVLESKGLLCHVTAEVDKDWEISAVCRHTFRTIPQKRRPALMFDRIKGSDIPLVVGILGGSRRIYATALETDLDGVWEKWERSKNPVRPRLVESGPCQEVVQMGEQANIEMLPAAVWTVGQDPGPYHTSPFVISRDPETRIPNVGVYRLQVKGPRKTGLMVYPPRNMNQHIRKNEARGRATEAAIVFGTDPVIGLTAVSPFPYGVDELAAAGGIRGEPVDVVRCLTVDLEVPATAEIVVEGRIPFQYREKEGPFGEYAGYMGEGGNHPVFEVSCITHRRNPIYQAFLSQMPPSESSCIKSFGREMEVRRHLKNNLGLPVQDVCITESSGATAMLLISLRKQNRFQPLKAMMGAWSLAVGIGKITIVVDDDIDIRDPFQVEWALSFRMQPAEDIHIERDTDPMALDPSQPWKDGKKVLPSEQVSSKVGIDATRKFPYPNLAAPPKEHLERVAANWAHYGIQEVKMFGALVAWAGTTLAGLLAGKSSKTAGAKDDKAPSKLNPAELLAVIGPYAFVGGLIVLVSSLAEVVHKRAESAGPIAVIASYLTPLGICVLFAWRVDINEFSLHAFYRNRLARCYLGASNIPRHPNPFTGFDEADAKVAVSDLLHTKHYYGPFPIFCTALNLTFGEDLAWQERKAASFVFTPLFSGYDVGWTAARDKTKLHFNGFVKTASYAYPSPGIHISTAAAISGAAMSPNWGYHTNPATAFLLTVFNVRLGWWLRNPRSLTEDGARLGLDDAIRPDGKWSSLLDPHPWPSPHFSLLPLVRELLGQTDDTCKYVYLTDGGHFDNMGLYELVRRRCRYIVICDAEDDSQLQFQGIGMAIRKCRIDFGAEIALDLRPLQHLDDTGNSSAHCVVGTIRYPEDKPEGKPKVKPEDKLGIVVYIKASLTGDEPADILNYKKEHSAFPHDTTLNQWFTESQFESYRRLGHHVAVSTFKPARPDDPVRPHEPARPDELPCTTCKKRADFFSNLRNIWTAFTPEMKQYSADHSERYGRLLEEIRTDVKLTGLFDLLFDRGDQHSLEWKKTHEADWDYAVRFSSKLIEFIFIVYLQLRLVFPDNLNHPFAEGWLEIFKSWCQIDVIKAGWKKYGPGYTEAFQIFAESEKFGLGLPKSKK